MIHMRFPTTVQWNIAVCAGFLALSLLSGIIYAAEAEGSFGENELQVEVTSGKFIYILRQPDGLDFVEINNISDAGALFIVGQERTARRRHLAVLATAILIYCDKIEKIRGVSIPVPVGSDVFRFFLIGGNLHDKVMRETKSDEILSGPLRDWIIKNRGREFPTNDALEKFIEQREAN